MAFKQLEHPVSCGSIDIASRHGSRTSSGRQHRPTPRENHWSRTAHDVMISHRSDASLMQQRLASTSEVTRIHPTTQVSPLARLAPGVEVGPYAIVEPGVRIGERTRV